MIIEKNIPIPPPWTTKACVGKKMPRRRIRYPFAQMEVGDSFLIRCADDVSEKERDIIFRRVTAAASSHRGRGNCHFKITVRRVDGGVRVWRIK